jgi:hypothetical protein
MDWQERRSMGSRFAVDHKGTIDDDGVTDRPKPGRFTRSSCSRSVEEQARPDSCSFCLSYAFAIPYQRACSGGNKTIGHRELSVPVPNSLSHASATCVSSKPSPTRARGTIGLRSRADRR